MELALADLNTVEKRKERVQKQVKSKDKNALIEDVVLDKLSELLGEGKPFSLDQFNEEEQPFAKNLHLLSIKPVIYAANVSESDLVNDGNAFVDQVRKYAEAYNAQTVVISAQIEAELAELSPDEAKEYLNDLGVTDSGIERMIRSVYDLLGLRTFFTAGEKEVRAWTVKAGAKAPQAAGEIHTDMEKGFIRAEITAYSDFVEAKSYAVAKEKGTTRLEGKEYVVQDGDIVHFRFAV